MALVHYLYIGHFIPEEGFVRIQDHRLVAAQPLNMEMVDMLLSKYLGHRPSSETLARMGQVHRPGLHRVLRLVATGCVGIRRRLCGAGGGNNRQYGVFFADDPRTVAAVSRLQPAVRGGTENWGKIGSIKDTLSSRPFAAQAAE